jgi:hypothetical protein
MLFNESGEFGESAGHNLRKSIPIYVFADSGVSLGTPLDELRPDSHGVPPAAQPRRLLSVAVQT